MSLIEWRHNGQRLILPIVVIAPVGAANPNRTIERDGLIDTGATGTGIRADLALELGLIPRGQRRVLTANGLLMASEYLFRVGFVCGNYDAPALNADRSLHVLEDEVLGFELQTGFAYPMLIGMDIIGANDLTITHDGRASLKLR